MQSLFQSEMKPHFDPHSTKLNAFNSLFQMSSRVLHIAQARFSKTLSFADLFLTIPVYKI